MAHDVFISYSSKDKQTADKICASLEAKEIRCWMAPRDITPGSDWSESVINAIENSRAFVMVFSGNANESDQIRREVQNAANSHVPLIPLRIENVTPSKSLQYFLATQHWLDAFPPPLENHLQKLAKAIRGRLDGMPTPEPEPARKPEAAHIGTHKRVDRRLLVGGGAATALVAGVGLWNGRELFSSLGGANGISVAVLPLQNRSNNPDQGYFSDGQTDAIATALTNVKGLTVVGQNSVYALTAQKQAPDAIAHALKVDYMIQGSVRWSGNEVSVTANLVKVGNSANLWAESYDRELSNILSTQAEIARKIAGSVRERLNLPGMPSTAGASKSHDVSQPADRQAAMDYLKAKALLRARASREPGGPITQAVELLRGVTDREPNFPQAWAMLAVAYGFIATYYSLYFTGNAAELKKAFDAWLPQAETAAKTAISLPTASADAYTAMGLIQNFRSKFILAEDAYKKALQLEPGNIDALHLYSLMLLCVGRVKEAVQMRTRLHDLDPFVLVYNAFTMNAYWVAKNDPMTMKMLQTDLVAGAAHPFVARQIALIDGVQGKHREAADAILKATHTYDPAIVSAAAKFMAGNWSVPAERPLSFFDMLYVFSGTPERALDYFETNLKAGMWQAAEAPQFWHPSPKFTALRNTQRFKDLMRSAGVVDFWRERGWPDALCRANGGSFVCD